MTQHVTSGPRCVLFSPHPDDEIITGTLPLRLMREMSASVMNVAVTAGSLLCRRSERLEEARNACNNIGFSFYAPEGTGFSDVTDTAARDNPRRWLNAVRSIAELLQKEKPDIVFMPHAEDWNRTHVGTNRLVMAALSRCPQLSCLVVETEYWAPMKSPNLLVGATPEVVAHLIDALLCHGKELKRNPYHLRLPAWMMDNVRRGSELVLGQGAQSYQGVFATLYRIREWNGTSLVESLFGNQVVPAHESLAGYLGLMTCYGSNSESNSR
ncbi:MAG: PIG-L family deacetylase [Gluconobacter potus]